MKAGNRSGEKKIPDSSHIGSMTRFMRPEMVSIRCARLAMSNPRPAKETEPKSETAKIASQLPRMVTPKNSAPAPRMIRIEPMRYSQKGAQRLYLPPIMDQRKWALFIGVATNRFKSLRTRMSTITKPTPQRPPPIRFMPNRPGTRKSM